MTSITVRDVPSKVRDELAARAARSGRSLQEYLRMELVELARRPTASDWVARVRSRKAASAVSWDTESILGHRDADRR